jgi:hypothetical protein
MLLGIVHIRQYLVRLVMIKNWWCKFEWKESEVYYYYDYSWDTRSNNYTKASHIVDAHAAEVNCVCGKILFLVKEK